MAYDDGLAERVRQYFSDREDIKEKKMFGGIAFMHNGNMCCGVAGERLMARVGADQYSQALQRAHAAEMDFTGKPLKGFVYVAPAGFPNDTDLAEWIALCETFTATLPPK